MRGIAGAVGTQDQELIKRMIGSLSHRGPDGVGYYQRDGVHLGAARLSIIDPASGSQPLFNETSQIWIVFNGEISNHRELRADLKRKGHIFTAETDTEVVLHLYEELGEDCVRHLRGMFVFAILDGERLFLARDRYGIKSLYYTFLPEAQLFLFASEIKGLLQCPEYTPQLDMQAWADSFVLGHTVGTETFFAGVKSLAAGHTLSICWHQQMSISEPKSYFTRRFIRDQDMALEEALNVLEGILSRSVEAHLAADVEVGLALSGGLDSSLLALLGHQSHLFTFSVSDREHHSDLRQAQHVARMIGSSHESAIVNFDEYLAAIPGCALAIEKPCGLFSLPLYILSGKISQQACLVGEGADELFGGYREYLNQEYKLAPIREHLQVLKQLGISPSAQTHNLVERLSSFASFDEYLQNAIEMNLSDRLECNTLSVFDKYGMASGVELRLPYLDYDVVEFANQLPLRYLVRPDLGIDKYLLRHLCLRRFGYAITDVVLRRKQGLPSAGMSWRQRFERLCDEMLPDDYLTRHKLRYCFAKKWELLMFELFCEIFLVHRGNGQAVGSILDFMRSR